MLNTLNNIDLTTITAEDIILDSTNLNISDYHYLLTRWQSMENDTNIEQLRDFYETDKMEQQQDGELVKYLKKMYGVNYKLFEINKGEISKQLRNYAKIFNNQK